MSQLSILTALVRGGMSPVGACAMGGNMMAESNMQSNIAQRGMTGLSDADYTLAADNRLIDFVNDGVGYGLCQWTFRSRKAALLEFAQQVGTSVGEEYVQTDFCILELERDYPELWYYLRSASDLNAATARICTEYERPAVNNIGIRVNYANRLFAQYRQELEELAKSGTAAAETSSVTAVTALDPQSPPEIAYPEGKLGDIDAEPNSYILGEVTDGRTPEAKYLAALLEQVGYDVGWYGLDASIKDYKQKKGLSTISQVWDELLKG